MPKLWRIEGSNGFQSTMPGNMSEAEVSAVLQRLVCRCLDEDEIVDASLRSNHSRFSSVLKPIGKGRPLHFGEDPFYTANLVEE